MGPVIRTAAMKPDVALLDNDDLQGVEGDDDWQFVSLGEQKNFGIRTAGELGIIYKNEWMKSTILTCSLLFQYSFAIKFNERTKQNNNTYTW